MQFWDTEPAKPVFDYDVERKRFIDNMEYLSTMSVEEQNSLQKVAGMEFRFTKVYGKKTKSCKVF